MKKKVFSAFFAALLLPFCAMLHAKTIVFLGDSLTAGYGLDEEKSYPQLIQNFLTRDGLDWNVVNAGISGDTTSGGLKRLSWVLKSKPTAVFLALGANDGLRGVDPDVTRENLEKIVTTLQKSGARVYLAGMRLPTNYGETFNKRYARVFPDLAKKHKLAFFPFLLEGVAMNPELNLPDGIHPNEKGQRILADRIYKFLKPLLEKNS